MAFSNTLVLCFFLAITMVALPTLATVHVVGDALGWTVGSDYTAWASDKTFVVGDSLVFNYEAGWHTVDEVGESNYKSCTTRNSISTDVSGATTIPLEKVGTHYFICAISDHCIGGMKLSVNVKASSASVASAPSPTPSSRKSSSSNGIPNTITTTPSTTTITTPSMQNASSTTILSPIVALFFVVILISYILM